MDSETFQQMRIIDKVRENSVWAISNMLTDIPSLRMSALKDYKLINFLNDSLTCLPEIQIDYIDLVLWLLRVLVLD